MGADGYISQYCLVKGRHRVFIAALNYAHYATGGDTTALT